MSEQSEAHTCLAFECDRPIQAAGRKFCGRCQKSPDFGIRLWPQVEKTSTCWLWKGLTGPLGYGSVTVRRTTIRVHRFVYELLRTPIPEGMVLDHLCRVRNCVNPDHMEVVTGAENTRRGIGFAGINSRKTHCKHGHEFTPENTYIRPNGEGRDCKECVSIRGWKRDRRAGKAIRFPDRAGLPVNSKRADVATVFWSSDETTTETEESAA